MARPGPFYTQTSCLTTTIATISLSSPASSPPSSSHPRGVKRNNGVSIIPLFLLKNFRYSIIPAQKFSLFHYSSQKSTHYSITPRTKFPLFLFHYSSSAPEHPPSPSHSSPPSSTSPYTINIDRHALPRPPTSLSSPSSHHRHYRHHFNSSHGLVKSKLTQKIFATSNIRDFSF